MGQYLDLAKQQAQRSLDEGSRFLEKTPGKVRAVSDAEVIIKPAVRPSGTPLPPVYWERQGRIVGPGQPEFFFRDSASQIGLILRYEGELVSVSDSMLRSRKAFLEQREVKAVELIREGYR